MKIAEMLKRIEAGLSSDALNYWAGLDRKGRNKFVIEVLRAETDEAGVSAAVKLLDDLARPKGVYTIRTSEDRNLWNDPRPAVLGSFGTLAEALFAWKAGGHRGCIKHEPTGLVRETVGISKCEPMAVVWVDPHGGRHPCPTGDDP